LKNQEFCPTAGTLGPCHVFLEWSGWIQQSMAIAYPLNGGGIFSTPPHGPVQAGSPKLPFGFRNSPKTT